MALQTIQPPQPQHIGHSLTNTTTTTTTTTTTNIITNINTNTNTFSGAVHTGWMGCVGGTLCVGS
jgi:hypothetical protein